MFILFKTAEMGKARRGLWSEKSLNFAVKAVLVDGGSNVKASRRYGIPLETVRRKVLIARQGLGVEKKLGRHTVLTLDEENELCEILTDMESRLYGLTPIDVRRIVYQYCAKNNIRNTFNVTKERHYPTLDPAGGWPLETEIKLSYYCCMPLQNPPTPLVGNVNLHIVV